MVDRQILKSKYLSFGNFQTKEEKEKTEYKSYITNYLIRKPRRMRGKVKSSDHLNQKLKLNISTDYFDLKKQAYRNLYKKQLNINNFNFYRAKQNINEQRKKFETSSNLSFSSNPIKSANLHEILQQAKKYILTNNNSLIGSHRRELLSLNNNPIFKKNIISNHENKNFAHELSPYDKVLSRSSKKNEYQIHHKKVDFISHKLFLINERRKQIYENHKNIREKKRKIVEAKNMKEKISSLKKTYDYLYPKYADVDNEETYGIIPFISQENHMTISSKEEERPNNDEIKTQSKSINIFIQD